MVGREVGECRSINHLSKCVQGNLVISELRSALPWSLDTGFLLVRRVWWGGW
jgi:hypothetical protein